MENEAAIKDMLIWLAKEGLRAEAAFAAHQKEFSSSIDKIASNLLKRSYVDKTSGMIESIHKGLCSYGHEAMAKRIEELWESLRQPASPNFTPEIVRFLLRLGTLDIKSAAQPLTMLRYPIVTKTGSEEGNSQTVLTSSESTMFTASEDSQATDTLSCVEPRHSQNGEWKKMTYRTLVYESMLMLQGLQTSSMKIDKLNGLQFASQVEMPSFAKSYLRKLSWYAVKYMKLYFFCEEVASGNWHGPYARSLECGIRQELNEYQTILVGAETEWKAKNEDLNEEDILDEDGLFLEEIELALWPVRDTFHALSDLVDLAYVDAVTLISRTFLLSQTKEVETKRIMEYALTAMCSVVKRQIMDWMFQSTVTSLQEEFFIQKVSRCVNHVAWSEIYFVDEALLPCFIGYELARKVLLVGKSIRYLQTICLDHRENPAFEKQRQVMDQLSPMHMFQSSVPNPFVLCVKEACHRISTVVLEIISSKVEFGFFMKVVKDVILLGRGDFFLAFWSLARSELEKPLTEASIVRFSAFLSVTLRECFGAKTSGRMMKWLHVELPDFQRSQKAYECVVITYEVAKPLHTLLDPGSQLAYKRLFLLLWRLRCADRSMSHSVYHHSTTQLQLSALPEVIPFHHRLSLLNFRLMNLIGQLNSYAFIDVIEGASLEFLDKYNNATDLDCIVNAQRNFLGRITDRLFLSGPRMSLRVRLRALLDVAFELIRALDKFNDRLDTELEQIALDAEVQQLRDQSGLWAVNSGENLVATKRRQELIRDVRNQFIPQFNLLEMEYYVAANTFLEELLKESERGFRNLSLAMDNTRWYCSKVPTLPESA